MSDLWWVVLRSLGFLILFLLGFLLLALTILVWVSPIWPW